MAARYGSTCRLIDRIRWGTGGALASRVLLHYSGNQELYERLAEDWEEAMLRWQMEQNEQMQEEMAAEQE